MATPYTHKQLSEVKNSAEEFGVGEKMAARFASEDLETERTGVSHHKINPNQRQPFGHKHDEAEEVYVVIAGSGRVKLDDQIVEIVELDAIRVAPEVVRCFEAGPEGIEVLAMGARHEGDGEIVPNWWTD